MQALKRWWTAFEDKHTTAAQFIVFFILSNGHTVFLFDYSAGSMSVGAGGETFADVITMIINAAISFWVFFPIFKVIFKQEATPEDAQSSDAQ